MSDGYSIVDGKKVSGRRISFDGENLNVSSAAPVEDESSDAILGKDFDESVSKMASAGDTAEEISNNGNMFVDEITAGHCFETPYGKIYVKSTEPVDVSLLERTKTVIRKNAIPFGLGLAVGLIGCGLYGLLKGKED